MVVVSQDDPDFVLILGEVSDANYIMQAAV